MAVETEAKLARDRFLEQRDRIGPMPLCERQDAREPPHAIIGDGLAEIASDMTAERHGAVDGLQRVPSNRRPADREIVCTRHRMRVMIEQRKILEPGTEARLAPEQPQHQRTDQLAAMIEVAADDVALR